MARLSPTDVWDKGRLYRRAYLVPGQGLSEDTFASGAPVSCANPKSPPAWLATLPDDIDQHIAPWFKQFERWKPPQTTIKFEVAATEGWADSLS